MFPSVCVCVCVYGFYGSSFLIVFVCVRVLLYTVYEFTCACFRLGCAFDACQKFIFVFKFKSSRIPLETESVSLSSPLLAFICPLPTSVICFHTFPLPSSSFRHRYRHLRVSVSHDALQSTCSPGWWWNCSDIY